MIIRTYSDLSRIAGFKERYEYLKLTSKVGVDTFGFDRVFNQRFYKSDEWKSIRNYVIVRDNGCDLGVDGYDIHKSDRIYIHHMNPISLTDIENQTEFLLEPEFLITTTFNTHQAIHYGSEDMLVTEPITRTKNDTCPWKSKQEEN